MVKKKHEYFKDLKKLETNKLAKDALILAGSVAIVGAGISLMDDL